MTDQRPEDRLPVETALIVPVPEADPVVAGLRARLDPAAALGVPAHVTVIAPFVPPDRIDADVLTALAETVGAVSAFDATFAAVSWFGESVVWLRPEPATILMQGSMQAGSWRIVAEFPLGTSDDSR